MTTATPDEHDDRLAITDLIDRAYAAMKARLIDGLRRGWGSGWKRDYYDAEAMARLTRAVRHLRSALSNHRAGYPGMDLEVQKRAADVANQAFMVADPDRLRDCRGARPRQRRRPR